MSPVFQSTCCGSNRLLRGRGVICVPRQLVSRLNEPTVVALEAAHIGTNGWRRCNSKAPRRRALEKKVHEQASHIAGSAQKSKLSLRTIDLGCAHRHVAPTVGLMPRELWVRNRSQFDVGFLRAGYAVISADNRLATSPTRLQRWRPPLPYVYDHNLDTPPAIDSGPMPTSCLQAGNSQNVNCSANARTAAGPKAHPSIIRSSIVSSVRSLNQCQLHPQHNHHDRLGRQCLSR